MSTTIPSPATTPSLIADYFEAAATHADNNKKVSYSDIKTLLKKVTNSSEKLTPENYQRVQTATGKLNSILENQKSNVTEKKALKIHEVFCKAFNKVPDIYLQKSELKATQGANTPHTLELTTKAKTVRQEDVIDLMKKTQSIKGKIDIFINDLDKPTYWRPSEKQYLGLQRDLLTLRNNIDKSRNSILSSSYQHNPSKIKMLTQLKSELTQHQEKLNKSHSHNLSSNSSISSQQVEDRVSSLNTPYQQNDNEMSSDHRLELAQLKKDIPTYELQLEHLKNGLHKQRNELNKLHNEKTLGHNIYLEKQTNEDNYVKNQGFQPATKNEDI